ncbi:hypothetical protein [Rhizobium sp. IMFF44]|uniref:hypothetical protein n=1 Tax=Rhizobium sp. IMFF44 TaxID=3342350 RepID=UPI0035B8B489
MERTLIPQSIIPRGNLKVTYRGIVRESPVVYPEEVLLGDHMNRILTTIALISLGAVAGCVTMDSAKPAMQAMKGKPVSVAIAKLGYPDGQMNIAGKKVYVWSSSSHGTYTVPTTTSTTTYINGMPIYGTAYGTSTESYDYQCKLKVIASPSDVIESWEWEGNIGGCERYAARLTSK